jgi:tetratricopeptide (TPR) repeat protein
MNKIFVFLSFAAIFTSLFSLNAFYTSDFQNYDFIQFNHQRAQIDQQERLLAECKRCDECGKEMEQLGDVYYKSGEEKAAKEAYQQAINIYKRNLKTDPNNRCLSSGLKRTIMKLEQFKN